MMGTRNSVPRLLPANPLGSILRETAREARRSTRDPNAVTYATDADFAALQAEVTALQAADTALQAQDTVLQSQITVLQKKIIATVLPTAAGGIGTWTFPTPFVNVPVLTATAISGSPVFCTIFNPTNANTQFVVWNAASVGVGGVNVNLVAYSRD